MDWAYGGVNRTITHYAGSECASYLNPTWRCVETVVVLFLVTYLFIWSYKRIQLPTVTHSIKNGDGWRNTLLVLMCIVWGMEIGYKFSSRTVIYLLNPCHITTAMQIYLLAAKSSRIVTAIFRFHLNLLNGPFLAYIFPETDTRLLPLEASIYWIQHGMMFLVPFYLLRLGGPFNIEEFSDISWNAFSYSINVVYHYLLLQPISIPTEVNLNHMLCPAPSDPFRGQYYRTCAVLHQAFLCPALCKLFCLLASLILTKLPATKVRNSLFSEDTTATGTSIRKILHQHEE